MDNASEVEVLLVERTSCMDGTRFEATGVDAEVRIGDVVGEVTLLPSDRNGELDSWGDLEPSDTSTKELLCLRRRLLIWVWSI